MLCWSVLCVQLQVWCWFSCVLVGMCLRSVVCWLLCGLWMSAYFLCGDWVCIVFGVVLSMWCLIGIGNRAL